MTEQAPWFVVIERTTMTHDSLPPYVLGPYATEAEAEAVGNDDGDVVYDLLTNEAKSMGYIATECYWTQKLPDTSISIDPNEED